MKNLIIIFWLWHNQTLENILRRSEQRNIHINPREHDVLTKNREHAPYVIVIR
jgi:DNA-binding winged helix-turn-helix (wHTH) protein